MKQKNIHLIIFLLFFSVVSFASEPVFITHTPLQNKFFPLFFTVAWDNTAYASPVKTDSLKQNVKDYPTHWNESDHTSGLHIGGLLLGLFLPVAGIFIAEHIGGKAVKNRKKWAVIGSIITLGLIALALISKATKY